MLSLVVLKLAYLPLSEMSLLLFHDGRSRLIDIPDAQLVSHQPARRAEAGEAGTGRSRSESHFFIYTEAWLVPFLLVL